MKLIVIGFFLAVIAGCTQQQQSQQPSAAAAESPAQLEVRVEPQQPKSGQEAKVTAELRDAEGTPISDAEVKITAVMKMGDMGDMRESATLKWTGSRYEGPMKPSMAGEWNVTVEAEKGGKVIATQKTKLKAE